MSADLMVFDKSKAPVEPMEFLKWFYEKTACPYDNAPMERFFNTLKNEFTYHHRFKSAKELDAGIIEYIFRWYNWERPHTHNKGVPPLLTCELPR